MPSPPSGNRSRRSARVAVLDVLYAREANRNVDIGLADLPNTVDLDDSNRRYATDLLAYLDDNRDKISEAIESRLAEKWTVSRLARVDRCLLLIATAEFYGMPAVPPKVTIAEALAMANRFSDRPSAKFVHGVLAAVLQDSPKKEWTPPALDGEEVEEPSTEPPEPEPEPEETVEEGSEQHDKMLEAGPWITRIEDSP
ncbi:MAG: transcription antitermination factor NusB [Fimbriimonadaceae bacterium]